MVERPLIAVVLDYDDQEEAPSVIEYRFIHALTVQLEPERPTHNAPLRSEGIGSRDS